MMNDCRYIISLSGGKDSTYLLHELIKRKMPLDEAVFFDTGWEFPQMYEHLGLLEDVCKAHNIKFTYLKPKQSFDYLMFEKPINKRDGTVSYGYSWCGANRCRWGTTHKLKMLNKYCGNKNIVYVGIACDETKRLQKERQANKRLPLVEWNITENECLNGCYALGYDWGGLYEHLDRVSCRFCALKNLNELRNIKKYYPSTWEDLKNYQSKTDRPYKGNGKNLYQLEKRFIFEDKRIEQGLSITNKDFYRQLNLIIRGTY